MTTTDQVIASAFVIPAFCGPLSDMGRDQVCKRAGRIGGMHAQRDDVVATAARIPRMRNARRAANLTAWVTEAEVRVGAVLASIEAKLPECTHPADQRREITTYEDALPECTC